MPVLELWSQSSAHQSGGMAGLGEGHFGALWQDSGQARHEFNLIDPVWPSMIYALCLKKAKMYLEKSWIARNFDIQHTLIYFHNHLPHSMPIFMCMIQHLHNTVSQSLVSPPSQHWEKEVGRKYHVK